jgi:predicted MFS family arabinose efflux permease
MGLQVLPIVVLVGLLLLNSTNAAFRDVAVDGIMCVEGKKLGLTGRIQSIQWISVTVAVMITGIGGGLIAEKWGYQMAFLCLIPIYILVGLAAFFYQETDLAEYKKRSKFVADMKHLFSHKKLIILGIFIFLYKYSPSFGTPLFFIQRDVFKWNKVWIGALGTIGTVFGIVGSLLYYKFSTRINLKKWIFWSVFLGAITSLSYLYYTPVTAVIYDVIYGLIGMFIFLMVMDFMARNSVKGLEATSFALLCSFSNLALTASNLSGAILLPKLGLNWLIILSSLTSFLCLPLIKYIDEK